MSEEIILVDDNDEEVIDVMERTEEYYKGDRGLNAYEVWLTAGNIGTVNDYIEAQKGETGAPFVFEDFTEEQLLLLTGMSGRTPVFGEDYFNGVNGKSSFELWLLAGNIGGYADYEAWQRFPAINAATEATEAADNATEAATNANNAAVIAIASAETVSIAANNANNAADAANEVAGNIVELQQATDLVEAQRVTNEGARYQAETTRLQNETTRQQSEITREANEGERVTSEGQRILNEQARVASGYLTSQEVGKIKRLTQAQYDSLNPKDNTTLYLIIQ